MVLRAWLVLVGAGVGGLLVGQVVGLVVRRAGRGPYGQPFALANHHCHRAFVATLASLALLFSLPEARLDGHAEDNVRHGFVLLLIATLAWLVIRVLFLLQDLTFARAPVDTVDNVRARRVRTQIMLLRSLTTVVVGVVAVASMLLTFGRLRAFGASLLASAGLVGIVVGAASQNTLRNVFAGLQVAFTDTLRIDDVVVVENEWGRVEQLSLMSVTLHLWDERRLVLPISYFTTNPFQNWTRTESRVLGAVTLNLDYGAPLAAIRAKTHELVQASPLWDGRDWVLQVVDSTPTTMVVRILASAADAPSSWDLRCDLREQIITWLQTEHPESFPTLRAAGGQPLGPLPGDRRDRPQPHGRTSDGTPERVRPAAPAGTRG